MTENDKEESDERECFTVETATCNKTPNLVPPDDWIPYQGNSELVVNAEVVEVKESVEEEEGNNRSLGAAVAFGLLTLPFGLFIATIASVSAAYGSTQDGTAGDVCRAAGDITLAACDKAVEVNKEQKLVERVREGMKEASEKHGTLEKVGKAFKITWKRFVDFENKHNLLQRGLATVVAGFKQVAEKMSSDSKERDPDHNSGTSRQTYNAVSK